MQRFKTTLSLSSMIFFLYKNQKILFKNKANPSKLGMYHGHKTIKIPNYNDQTNWEGKT